MSLLSEIKAAVTGCGLPVETGVFSGEPPEEYVVVTPLADTYELHADNLPGYEAQEARLSLFSKGNYLMRKGQLSNALLAADFVITDRRYIGHEDDTGYHHYAIDVANCMDWRNELWLPLALINFSTRKITEGENGDETYAAPVALAKAMTAELSVELAEATLYADDGAAAVVKEFQSGTLTLGVDDIGVTVAQDLTGATIDGNKVLVSTSEDGGTPVAVGFRAKKANGKYRYFWLYRVKFGIPATNLTTKGESIEFSTPSIEGTVTRRNKVDGQGKHPWKAEVSEDDTGVLPATISGWYEEVYEPDYSTLETA